MSGSLVYQICSRFLSFAVIVTLANWVLLGVGAAIRYFIWSDNQSSKTFSGFIRYCFPPEIIKTRSSRVDGVYWVLSWFAAPLFIAPFMVGSIFCSALVYEGLTKLFGVHAQLAESTATWLLVGIVVTIAVDFATFYTHYLDHRIVTLWQFHKVHHSAEFLTPITNKRFHPIEKIFDDNGVTLAAGVLLGIFSYIFSMPIYSNTIIGVDAYFVLNTLSFFHLRHSHIDLSYGRFEKWLLSPAQHQLHHSLEGRHWDKNFGLFLSVWDRWFGTFAYSEPRGSYRLGLAGNEGERYQSVLQLYTTPFVNIWNIALEGLRSKGIAVRPKDIIGPRRLRHALYGQAFPQREPGNVEDRGIATVGPNDRELSAHFADGPLAR